ncbi:MAG: hypothetical protein F4X97_08180 [Boseongicola sp. SB0662_bin_57]|nr:hypothetical protein [Boseongicola sp. SB0662_bin_57]
MDWPTTLTLGGTMIATGVALAAIILPGLRELRRDVGDLRERMARLEGLFDGFTKRSGKRASEHAAE